MIACAAIQLGVGGGERPRRGRLPLQRLRREDEEQLQRERLADLEIDHQLLLTRTIRAQRGAVHQKVRAVVHQLRTSVEPMLPEPQRQGKLKVVGA